MHLSTGGMLPMNRGDLQGISSGLFTFILISDGEFWSVCPPPPYTYKTRRYPWEAVFQRFSEEIAPTLNVCTNNLWTFVRTGWGRLQSWCGQWFQAWRYQNCLDSFGKAICWPTCWPTWINRLGLWDEPSCLTLDSSLFLIFPNDIILLIFHWCIWKKVPLISPHRWRSKIWNFT